MLDDVIQWHVQRLCNLNHPIQTIINIRLCHTNSTLRRLDPNRTKPERATATCGGIAIGTRNICAGGARCCERIGSWKLLGFDQFKIELGNHTCIWLVLVPLDSMYHHDTCRVEVTEIRSGTARTMVNKPSDRMHQRDCPKSEFFAGIQSSCGKARE